MREKILLALVIVLFVVLVFVFMAARKTFESVPKETVVKEEAAPKDVPIVQEERIYDIDKIRPKEKAVFEEPKDLAAVYRNFSKSDAGDDDADRWSRMDLKERAELMKSSRIEIEKYKKALQKNPSDKRAKSLLFVAESLKKMEEQGFDAPMEEPAAKSSKK